ncbi:hypothetical protein DSO57_1021418 [Entomophthora muscae]|uniref:Uncharacterized protein n=1 Tax=Entomophthora muscae TaxID=34485 RepID=A0ACC2SGD0_9FUNG|nr:hypothetical protein DSO57_1021418 [Entomophthora muscae]
MRAILFESAVSLPVICPIGIPTNNTYIKSHGVITKFPELPANVSYNTQGALNELPLDVSNNMNQSDGNVELQALSPN